MSFTESWRLKIPNMEDFLTPLMDSTEEHQVLIKHIGRISKIMQLVSPIRGLEWDFPNMQASFVVNLGDQQLKGRKISLDHVEQ